MKKHLFSFIVLVASLNLYGGDGRVSIPKGRPGESQEDRDAQAIQPNVGKKTLSN